ncbi:hypothetical protein [Specibacter sp. NPDC078692]|uniref:hypothetical protein n=1 Tax=Specibacter sp. NPDC078692 TaxID=3155818 RepID=UPI003445F8E5
MSGSPKPSAPAGTQSAAVEVEIPDGMFFDAADYNEANTPLTHLEMTRRKVSKHRSALKSRVTLLLEDLARISSSLHAADRQGNAAPHWDSAHVLAGKLEAAVSHLADQIGKAERRYEESFSLPLVDVQ